MTEWCELRHQPRRPAIPNGQSWIDFRSPKHGPQLARGSEGASAEV